MSFLKEHHWHCSALSSTKPRLNNSRWQIWPTCSQVECMKLRGASLSESYILTIFQHGVCGWALSACRLDYFYTSESEPGRLSKRRPRQLVFSFRKIANMIDAWYKSTKEAHQSAWFAWTMWPISFSHLATILWFAVPAKNFLLSKLKASSVLSADAK